MKKARLRLSLLLYDVSRAGVASARGGAWPLLWGTRPLAAAEGQGAPGLARDGLQRLEARWVQAWQEAQAAAQLRAGLDAGGRPPAEVHPAQLVQHAWLDLDVGRLAPRQPPVARGPRALARFALRQQQPVPPPLPVPAAHALVMVTRLALPNDESDAAQVLATPKRVPCRAWRELLDDTLVRDHRTVAWRVLHGGLMVGGLQCHLRIDPLGRASCCPACAAQGRAQELETLSHAFVDCPSVAPAAAWLLQVVAALAGGVPLPPAADVPLLVLADLPGLWEPVQQLPMWRRLRVAYLGCVWHTRCRGVVAHNLHPSAPTATAAAVVDTLRQAVLRDWRRTLVDARAEAHKLGLPSTWFAGRDPRLIRRGFDSLWRPTQPSWFDAPLANPLGGPLIVRLSLQWPVLFTQVLAGFAPAAEAAPAVEAALAAAGDPVQHAPPAPAAPAPGELAPQQPQHGDAMADVGAGALAGAGTGLSATQ